MKQVSNLETYSGQAGLEIILSQSDIIVVLLPLTSETRHLLNSDTLGNVNKRANNRGACIINFARGAIIDKQALTDKIANQQIEHAVLDVFDKEPLADSDPLWQNPNITILPHISAPTNMTTASVIAVDNILNWLDSGQLPRTVDRQKQY